MLMVATLATLTHARQLSEQSVSVCEGIETQQCEADGVYYSCACTVCNLTRSCESNSDLYRCACPHQIAPQFDSNDDDDPNCIGEGRQRRCTWGIYFQVPIFSGRWWAMNFIFWVSALESVIFGAFFCLWNSILWPGLFGVIKVSCVSCVQIGKRDCKDFSLLFVALYGGLMIASPGVVIPLGVGPLACLIAWGVPLWRARQALVKNREAIREQSTRPRGGLDVLRQLSDPRRQARGAIPTVIATPLPIIAKAPGDNRGATADVALDAVVVGVDVDKAPTIDERFGPRPPKRTWRDEWVDVHWAKALDGRIGGDRGSKCGFDCCTRTEYWRSDFKPGGKLSVDTMSGTGGRVALGASSFSKEAISGIEWKVERGWSREHAVAFSLIPTVIPFELHAAVLNRSMVLNCSMVATIHVMIEALSRAALSLGQPAVPTYMCLTGLAKKDSAWLALLQPTATVGMQFFTNAFTHSFPATSNRFHYEIEQGDEMWTSNGMFWWVNSKHGGKSFSVAESDIVCFRSVGCLDGDDGKLVRTLVPTGQYGRWMFTEGLHELPPLARITLDQIDNAYDGEVTVAPPTYERGWGEGVKNAHAPRKLRMRRRLYTVSVAYPSYPSSTS